MVDEERKSRRTFLKGAGALSVIGVEAAVLASLEPDLTNGYTKAISRTVRDFPGLDYPGTPVTLSSIVGGKTILTADGTAPGYWKGAPGMEYDTSRDRVLVHVRHRTAESRGNRASIYEFDHENWNVEELVAIEKEDIGAESMEGGEILEQDGEYRWFLSYQSKRDGDWRIQERRAATVSGLQSGGTDLRIASERFHHKDPVFLDDRLYVSANTRDWLGQGVERIDPDERNPEATPVSTEGTSSIRPTAGCVIDDEIFADVLPDVPLTDVPNMLWTSDEQSYVGSLRDSTLSVGLSKYLASSHGGSVKYIDVEPIGEDVLVLWQRQNPDGSNDLAGAKITLDEYEGLVNSFRE